jgi:hypothetical protein
MYFSVACLLRGGINARRVKEPTMNPRPELTDAALEQSLRASRKMLDAPEHVIHRALAVFTARRQAEAQPSLLRRLAAVLTFDSGAASPLAFGMRSSGGAVRQLLFSVEGRDIDLRIAPAAHAQTFALSGQILGPDSLGVVVMEPEDGGERREVALSEMGEFQLPAVAAGTYRLTLELNDMAIDLPLVRIPQAA